MSYPERDMAESNQEIPDLSPERMAELPPDVQKYIDYLHSEIEKLEELAGHDGLTGLDSRRRFDEALPREIAASVRLNKPFSLIMIDIDNFKMLNDLYGHIEGDSTLKKVAQATLVSIRGYDQAFRYGGEELAVLVNIDINNANGVAERIRKAIEREGPITVSLGVAQFTPDPSLKTDDEESLQTIARDFIQKTDSALYEAKADGKNRTAFMNPAGQISVIQPNSNNLTKTAGK